MKVSELARQAGVAPSAVRFYEAEGILPPPRRTGSGYRDYGETDLCRLRMLVSLRSLGLELPEAGRLAGMCADGRCDDMAVDLVPLVAARRAEVARMRMELDHLDAELRRLQSSIGAGEAFTSSSRGDDATVSHISRCEGRSPDDPADCDR